METIIETNEELIKLREYYETKNYTLFIKLCNYIRENCIHVLGFCIEKKLFDNKHMEIIEYNYNCATTLRTMFNKYEFEEIKFYCPGLRFKREEDINLLEITQIGELGMGVFPKRFDKDMPRFWNNGINHFYSFPQILDIDVKLNSFYEEVSPKNLLLSKRKTQREVADFFYKQLMINNKYPQKRFNNFIKNHCMFSGLEKIVERKKTNIVINEEGADMRIKREFIGGLIVEFNYKKAKYVEEREILQRMAKLLKGDC